MRDFYKDRYKLEGKAFRYVASALNFSHSIFLNIDNF